MLTAANMVDCKALIVWFVLQILWGSTSNS